MQDMVTETGLGNCRKTAPFPRGYMLLTMVPAIWAPKMIADCAGGGLPSHRGPWSTVFTLSPSVPFPERICRF